MDQATLDFAGSAGPDFDQARDGARLGAQLQRVRDLMLDGQARTVAEIAALTGDPEPSVSAQLRHLRKPRFGGHNVRKRVRTAPALYEYFIATGCQAATESVPTSGRTAAGGSRAGEPGAHPANADGGPRYQPPFPSRAAGTPPSVRSGPDMSAGPSIAGADTHSACTASPAGSRSDTLAGPSGAQQYRVPIITYEGDEHRPVVSQRHTTSSRRPGVDIHGSVRVLPAGSVQVQLTSVCPCGAARAVHCRCGVTYCAAPGHSKHCCGGAR